MYSNLRCIIPSYMNTITVTMNQFTSTKTWVVEFEPINLSCYNTYNAQTFKINSAIRLSFVCTFSSVIFSSSSSSIMNNSLTSVCFILELHAWFLTTCAVLCSKTVLRLRYWLVIVRPQFLTGRNTKGLCPSLSIQGREVRTTFGFFILSNSWTMKIDGECLIELIRSCSIIFN